MRYFWMIFYYAIASKLPKSTVPVVGKLAKRWRRICGEHLFAKCGTHLVVEQGAYIGNGKDFSVGSYVGIGKNFTCHSRIVTIEDQLMMGENVTFLGGGHNFDRTDIPMAQQGSKPKTPLHIAGDVWKGANAMILPGCKRIFAESDIDLVHKLGVAQKEVYETIYWLKVLNGSELISDEMFSSLRCDVDELMRIITASIKTVKSRLCNNQ